MYCIDSDEIGLHTFGFSGEDNEILNLQGQRAAKISTQELLNILTSNFKTFKDKTGGSVAFVQNCTMFDKIQMNFLKAISDKYQGISVQNLKIEPQNPLPENFDTFKFKTLYLTTDSSTGLFRISFVLDDLSSKNLYFKYSFKATMPILVALNSLEQGQILSTLDYQKSVVEFDKFDKNSLQNLGASNMMVKSKIKAGQTLMIHNFIELSLVRKGDKLNAVLNDGGLSVIIEVIALQNGNLGDDIMVKSSDKKSFKANITSKNQVIIR